jgi:hypothetical protein
MLHAYKDGDCYLHLVSVTVSEEGGGIFLGTYFSYLIFTDNGFSRTD